MQPLALLKTVLHEVDELKAVNVVHFDVQAFTPITYYMVIATGTSSRHVKSLADYLVHQVKMHHIKPCTMQIDKDCEWALVDLGDVIVHIMQARTRDFYNLEQLWSPQTTTASTRIVNKK